MQLCTNYLFIYRMFKGMIVIFAAVLTAATAKEAKGKYLRFTANLWLYFQIYQPLSSLHNKYVSLKNFWVFGKVVTK